MLEPREIQLLTEQIGFWNRLTDKQKDTFISHTTIACYRKDSSIHTADLGCVRLLLPKRGSLRVYILSEEGKEITLYCILPGNVCILSDAMWAMQSILFMSSDKSLAIFLLDETDKTGSPLLKIAHEEIAKYTGSVGEVVSRMLKYFSLLFFSFSANSIRCTEYEISLSFSIFSKNLMSTESRKPILLRSSINFLK